jgi:hypothetical protein
LLVGRIDLEHALQTIALLLWTGKDGREPEPGLLILGLLAYNLLQQAAGLVFVSAPDGLDRFLKVLVCHCLAFSLARSSVVSQRIDPDRCASAHKKKKSN